MSTGTETQKEEKKRSTLAPINLSLKALALGVVIFSAISYFIALVLGPVMFFTTPDGLTASARTIHGFSIVLFMILPVPIPVGTSLGALFMVIWGFFLVCMILAWSDRDGFLQSIRGALSKSISLAKTNFLFMMPLVASALFSATIIISQFQQSQGVQTGSINFPTTNPYVILAELSYAPLEEEFAFRITSIGLLVGVILLIVYRHDPRLMGLKNKVKLILLAMFSPELAKAKMGYRNVRADGFLRGISPVEWALILLTSVVFGLAHFLAGSGWEIGKVSTAFLAGFVFAIMYVAYGAYASILMHWYFNYYFDVIDIGASAYGGLITQLSTLSDFVNLVGGTIILVIFLVYASYKIGSHLATKASGTTTTPVPTP
jgi:hypothetical protein